MKLVKVDRRHARSSSGYQAFFQLRKNESRGRIVEHFESMYGPSREWVQNGSWGFYTTNANWCYDVKRRRVYLKNPEDATVFLLKNG